MAEFKWPQESGGGAGDVVGPASSTDNAVARFNGVGGKLLQNSGVTIDDSGNIATPGTVDGRDVSADGAALDAHIADTSVHGISGDVVGTTDTQTLSAKTLTSPKITGVAVAPSYVAGTLWYDSVDNTMRYFNDSTSDSVNIGQEMNVKVRNTSGSTLNPGQVVRITGGVSSLPTVSLAQANSFANAKVFAVITETIANNANGYATISGLIKNLNLSAFSVGDILYLSASVAGALTATRPAAPNYSQPVGSVVDNSGSTGRLIVDFGGRRALGFGTANQVYGINSGGTEGEYKTFAAGTAGTDFAIAHTTNTVTFNIPSASAANRGLVTTAAQTFGGVKTLTSPIFVTTAGVPDGSVTVPALAFTSDADGTGTGIYRVGANSLGFAANGVNIGQYSNSGAWTFGPAVTGNFAGQRHIVSGYLYGGNVTSTTNSGAFGIGTNYRASSNNAEAGRTDTATGGSGIVFINRTTDSDAGILFYANQAADATSTGADLTGYITQSGFWVLQNLHNAGATAPVNITNGNLGSGRYTASSLTVVANITGTPAPDGTLLYSRVGNIVTVSGRVDLTPTLAVNTLSGFTMPLPIASTFTASSDLRGSGGMDAPSGQAFSPVVIFANTSTNRAEFYFNAASNGSRVIIFTFQYEVK